MLDRVGGGPGRVAVPAFLVLTAACAGPSVEERIRAQLDEMEQLVEERKLSALLDHVSDRYTDNHGNDREGLRSLMAYRLRPGRSIHVLKKIRVIEVTEPGSARADLLLAAADAPLDSWPLDDLDAEFLRVELTLEPDDSRWRIVRAAWRRAGPADAL